MSPRLTLRFAARTDVAQAAHWYEVQRSGLGIEFLNEFIGCWFAWRRTLCSFRRSRSVCAGVYCAGFRLECISSHEQTGLKSLRSYTFTGNLEYGKAGRKNVLRKPQGRA